MLIEQRQHCRAAWRSELAQRPSSTAGCQFTVCRGVPVALTLMVASLGSEAENASPLPGASERKTRKSARPGQHASAGGPVHHLNAGHC